MNSKGFSTISFLLFLPLILSLCFGVILMLWLMNQKHSIQNICYAHIMDAQSSLIRGNDQLLQLNPFALSLIQRKKMLNLIIASSPPQAKAIAQAQKIIVIAQQKGLYLKQKNILLSSHYLSKKNILLLSKNIKIKFLKINSFWNTGRNIRPAIKIHWVPSQIKIHIRDIASTYVRSPDHSIKQKMKVSWVFNLKEVLPSWIINFIPISKIWRGDCGSYPEKETIKWIAKIGKGKRSLKPFY